MATLSYQEVLKLAQQLTPDEQKALVAHLQGRTASVPPKLSTEEWIALLNSMKIDSQPGPDFSLRREDWYGDDGR